MRSPASFGTQPFSLCCSRFVRGRHGSRKRHIQYLEHWLWKWNGPYRDAKGRRHPGYPGIWDTSKNNKHWAYKDLKAEFDKLGEGLPGTHRRTLPGPPAMPVIPSLRVQGEPVDCAPAGAKVDVSVRLFVRGPGRTTLGEVTATGPGLSLSTTRSNSDSPLFSLPVGTTITITATPGPGNIFAGWHAARCGWPYENNEVPGVHGGRQASWSCTITAPNPPVPGQGHGPFVIVADAFFCDPNNTPAGLCESLPRG